MHEHEFLGLLLAPYLHDRHFCWYQPSSMVVTTVARAPVFASAISWRPSGLLTAATGIPGFRGRPSRSGVPQIDVQIPQCTYAPGLTAIAPMAPFCSNSSIFAGNAKPGDDDLAQKTLGCGQRRILSRGEQCADRSRVGCRHVDELAFDAVAAIPAAGGRLGLHHPAGSPHLRPEGNAEIHRRFMHGHRHALVPQLPDDDIGALVHVLWPPARHCRERLDQRPSGIDGNGVDDRVGDELLLHARCLLVAVPRQAFRRRP